MEPPGNNCCGILTLVTGTRMYNQLLKLINERREQKKMIEEKESLKESVV